MHAPGCCYVVLAQSRPEQIVVLHVQAEKVSITTARRQIQPIMTIIQTCHGSLRCDVDLYEPGDLRCAYCGPVSGSFC